MKRFILHFVQMCFVITSPFVVKAAEDSEFVQVARDRYYLGGLDEADLKVQLHLVPNEKYKNLDMQESDEGF